MFLANKLLRKSFTLLKKKQTLFFTLQKTPLKNFCQEKPIKEEEPEIVEAEILQDSSKSHIFKAETKRLLNIVANSLYTDKDVFVRELLSNASDALEKQRFTELQGQSESEDPLQINLITNEKKRQLIIQDTGIGMSHDEMVENLGTIASSGSKKFLDDLDKTKESKGVEDNLIGQFGVGFYSAFIVGDTVEVFSKRENEDKTYCWRSDGSGKFSIAEVNNFHLDRGTRIVIHLRPEFEQFCKVDELKKIIDKYSNFINYDIFLNHEKINAVKAIWTQNKSSLKEEDYQNFYEHISKSKLKYKYKIHYSVEIPLAIKSLLYVPSNNSEMYGLGNSKMEVDLYCRKVLIKKNCDQLLPPYLRFVKGVVDCEDLPLNISRENYQDSALMAKLRSVLTKRVLRLLEQEMKRDLEGYKKWHKDFQMFLKEGLHSDKENSELILSLCRFNSTFGDMVSLNDYLAKMKTGQKKIYFFLCSSNQAAKNSPYMEQFYTNDIPVLYISVNIEEMIFRELQHYKNFNFANIEELNTELPKELLKEKSSMEIEKKSLPKEDQQNFTMWIRNELQPVVTIVNVTSKLSNSPAMLVGQVTSGMRQMLAFMDQAQLSEASKNLTMEINPNHDIIIKLNELRKTNPKEAVFNLRQILDTTMLSIGLPFDTANFLNRTNMYILKDLENKLGNEDGHVVIEGDNVVEGAMKNEEMDIGIEVGNDGNPNVK